MDNDLALIKAQIAELQSRVEGLTARGLDRLPPPVQIAEVNSSGQFLDWNNSAYVADTTVAAISPKTTGNTYVLWRPQAQQWEVIGGGSVAIGTLNADLNQGSSATFTFAVGGTGADTVYDNLLCSGDKVANGSGIVVAKISGKWYLINAVCACV